MSADLEKLLPCPFCGEPAKSYVSRDDDHDRYGEVCCTGCHASVRGPHLHWMDNTADEIASQFQAEMRWNRRTPDLARQVIALTADNAALRAKAGKLAEAVRALRGATLGETGFAACVRADSGLAYPWPALEIAEDMTAAALTEWETP